MLCNMAIEMGAKAGLVAPDDTTFNYLKGRQFAPTDGNWAQAVSYWRKLKFDDDAQFDTLVPHPTCRRHCAIDHLGHQIQAK